MEKNSTVEFKFDHVHIKCHDLDTVKKFYEEVFDAKILYEGKARNARMVMMELGGNYINLSEPVEGERLESPKKSRDDVWIRYGIGHFGVAVNDLDKATRELKIKGAEFIWEPRDIREGVRVAFIRGPEDDVIEIVQRNKLGFSVRNDV
jgi:predicted enzyme related to lactoylglutathione lyase